MGFKMIEVQTYLINTIRKFLHNECKWFKFEFEGSHHGVIIRYADGLVAGVFRENDETSTVILRFDTTKDAQLVASNLSRVLRPEFHSKVIIYTDEE